MTYKFGLVEWSNPIPGPYGLKILSDLGFDGMELDFGSYEEGLKLSNHRVQEAYLECADRYNMEFPSIALNALCDHGMSRDRDTYDGIIAVEVIKKGIETAKRMGIPVVQLPSFHNDRGDINSDKDFYNTAEMLRFACDISEEAGIVLAMENVMSVERTLEMIDLVKCDRLKLMYDTENYFLNHGYNQAEVLKGLSDHVIQVHVKDGFNNQISCAILGTGDTGFFETAKVINDTKCTEWILVENYYNRPPLIHWDTDYFNTMERDVKILKETFI